MDGMVKDDGLLGDGGESWLHSGSRRRRWSAARKAVIVAESLVVGAKVSEVAARHGVNANMLSAWRGQVSAGGMTRSRPTRTDTASPNDEGRAELQESVVAFATFRSVPPPVPSSTPERTKATHLAVAPRNTAPRAHRASESPESMSREVDEIGI